MHSRSRVTVADSTGGTLGPEETSGANQRTALPTASPPHALQAGRRGLRNGNDTLLLPSLYNYIYFPIGHGTSLQRGGGGGGWRRRLAAVPRLLGRRTYGADGRASVALIELHN